MYIYFVITQALKQDAEAVIYDWFPFPTVVETVIEWSNGVISQYWSFV